MQIQLKICGNHSLHDVQLVAKSNADYIGFVFAESKRKAKPLHVREWLKNYRLKQHQKTVGVFVNPTFAEIAAVVRHIPLNVIQLHGNEPPEQVAIMKNMFSAQIWKVIHHNEKALNLMDIYQNLVDAYLIDHKTDTAWGGTGQSFDWSFVPAYVKKAHSFGKRCFIAGGINAENIQKLLTFNPDGIDLASGVERDRQKDESKILELQERIEQYECHHTA